MSSMFFIKRPRFALVISIIITLLGVLASIVMPVDQYPDITSPKVRVTANYPGASSDTVKDSVAGPIEDQVNGVEGMTYMSSMSASDGSYILTVTFEIGTDANQAQQEVQNRVNLALPYLPSEVVKRGIKVRKRSPDMLMVINLLSPDNSYDSIFLSNYASINVQPELARIAGVSEARIIGALDYGMRVWLDPLKMANNNISVNQVVAALQEQNVQAAIGQLGAPPLPESTQYQYVLKTQGRLKNEEEFGNIILRADPTGSVLRLQDVARIELGAKTYKGFGEVDNQDGVILAIYKLSDANSLEVAELIKEKMHDLSAYFPKGVEYKIGHDTTLFIEASLEETVLTLIFTILLVIFVTYLFLGTARATLIPTVAIPVSIIGTLAVLYAFGMSINTVTLFALILAIGIVVDDAILVIENVERIMHDEGLEARPATEKAMKEVGAPIVGTSLVLAAVFAPTMLLPGITGQMFAQFGMTLVVSVLISMINALSLSPALSVLVMKQEEHKPNALIRGFNKFFSAVTRGYMVIVNFLVKRMVFSGGVIIGLLAILYLMFNATPTSFLPNEDKGFLMADVQLPPSSSLNRTTAFVDQLYESVKDDPNIETFLIVNGFSILNFALQSNTAMLIIKLKPWHERKSPEQHQFALQRKYQQAFNQFPEGRSIVFGAPAIPGLGAVAGFSYQLEDTQGRGSQQLYEMMNKVILKANQSEEATRVYSTFNATYPQIWVEIDRTRAKTLGVAISDIFLTMQTQLGSLYVNDINLFGKSYMVMVQAEDDARQVETDLDKIYVPNNKGELIVLSELLTTSPTQGADVLYKYNTYDSALINGIPDQSKGFSSGDALDRLETISAEELLPGYKFEWSDSSYEERKSGNMAPIALGLSLVFTYLFLAALYESFLTPAAIILSVPIAILGAMIALTIAGLPLSLYGQIGMVLLVGMASKVAILVVEFGKSLREAEGYSLDDAASTAARLRFRPVVMTGMSFAVGVFPLVIASGAGAASRVSLGLIVFGGSIMIVVSGTLLVPIFFKLIQSLREKIHGGKTPAPE